MRILVLGTSSSAGTGLADPSRAWPYLVRDTLAATLQEPVEVEHVIVFPVGDRAVSRAMAAVERVRPDLVIYAYGAYPCAVATVGARVRRKYGERVHRSFRRIELRFEHWTANRDGPQARVNTWGRWLARRVIGADPIATYEEVRDIHVELMRTLAQREGLDVIAFGEPSMGRVIARDNPGANPMLARMRDEVSAAARSHHHRVADCIPAFDAHPSRDHLFHSDGVHKTVPGHELQAAVVLSGLTR